jgi:hypothetical protein
MKQLNHVTSHDDHQLSPNPKVRKRKENNQVSLLPFKQLGRETETLNFRLNMHEARSRD